MSTFTRAGRARGFVQIMLLVLWVLSVFFTMKPDVGYACSCAAPPSVEDALNQKDAVFSGKVIEMNEKKRPIMSSADPITVRLQVDQVWKGEVGKTQTISTARDGASCGFHFEVGHEYIIYAHAKTYGGDERLETILCDRTKLLSAADEDLNTLGRGEPPAHVADPKYSENKNVVSMWISVAVFGLLLVVVVTFYMLKRIKR